MDISKNEPLRGTNETTCGELLMAMSCGVDLETRDSHGRTALMLAVCDGHDRWVSVLLSAGADIEAKDFVRGWTAALFACGSMNGNCLEVLIKAGANTEAMDNRGERPLMRAAEGGCGVLRLADRGWM